MKVNLFIPCFVDQVYPETGFNMVKLLRKAGCEVVYNPAQTCCGQPAFNAGFWDQSRTVCEKFIRDFSEAEYVVAPSGSCVGFVRNFYSDLFDNSALHNECKQLQRVTFELTEFLVNVLHFTDFNAEMNGVATYHDACGALRECKIKEPPRALLSKVKGLELREMNECETCCGFGGTFAVKYDDISAAMAGQKVDNAVATGADYIISTDLSCLMHVDGYIKKQKAPVRVMHIADVLASGW
ncbi:MAG: (Fe-S)-binding protein [Chitinophagales bacterium]|nr:(Fe-S)-binding protein [Bacteroidota bacterium]MBX7142745.1 (Fe-S)-binding protein [Chitinophagales bacterium]